jgi:hypothetical protein
LTRALVPADQAPLAVLPARQAGWVAAQVAVAVALWVSGLWASHPELSLSLALSAGPVAASPRRWWALPLVAVGVVGAGLATAALGAPAILGAGAIAGAAAALLVPDRTDWLDVVNAGLGSLAGAGLGLWAALQLVPGPQHTLVAVLVISALVGLVASQGLLPVALRIDGEGLPSYARINRTLRPPYRPPVARALELFGRARPHAPDRTTRKGMAEVVTWVYRLQLTLQSHDDAVGTIDPIEVQERIDACLVGDSGDAFTRERRQATAAHLHRLLDHRTALLRERGRTEALVDYALAFLEEASAGLAVARELPGEAKPDRLPEVLHRLRDHADAGDARRETRRELDAIEV